MLVLTRKPGQSVYIGDDIKIHIMEIRGNQVRVGVEAPSAVRIYREEIYVQISEENQTAATQTQSIPNDLSSVAEAWQSSKSRSIASVGASAGSAERSRKDSRGEE